MKQRLIVVMVSSTVSREAAAGYFIDSIKQVTDVGREKMIDSPVCGLRLSMRCTSCIKYLFWRLVLERVDRSQAQTMREGRSIASIRCTKYYSV